MVDASFPKVGMMVHHQTPIHRIGFYQVGMYGQKHEEDFSCETIKLDFGVTYMFGKYYDNLRLYAGLNTQAFWNVIDDNPTINIDKVHRISLDIGASKRMDNFTMLFFMDIWNGEASIGISYWL